MPRLSRPDPRALKRSIWSSISRLISIVLGTASASLIHQLSGGGGIGWGIAIIMALVSIALIVFVEYEREKDVR